VWSEARRIAKAISDVTLEALFVLETRFARPVDHTTRTLRRTRIDGTGVWMTQISP
jgi:hypothetical protein